MTKIYLINLRTELLIHGIGIDYDSKKNKIDEYIRILEREHGDLERVIVSMGTVRIMDRGDQIPIPIKPAVVSNG